MYEHYKVNQDFSIEIDVTQLGEYISDVIEGIMNDKIAKTEITEFSIFDNILSVSGNYETVEHYSETPPTLDDPGDYDIERDIEYLDESVISQELKNNIDINLSDYIQFLKIYEN